MRTLPLLLLLLGACRYTSDVGGPDEDLDGYGNAWSSALVLQENPTKTKAQVDQIMADYLGVDRYVTPELNYDIEHFDTFGKLLAPDTMLWGAFPQGTTPWAWSEAALKQIRKLQSPYGWPYKIHRMPLYSAGYSWTAYINSLMTQDKIVMSAYYTANDDAAKAIYEAAAPGYDVAKVSAQGNVSPDKRSASATKGSQDKKFAAGAGVALGFYGNEVQAIVDGGAAIDAADDLVVAAELVYPPQQLRADLVQNVHNALYRQPQLGYQNFQVAHDGIHLSNLPQAPGQVSTASFLFDRLVLREEMRGVTVRVSFALGHQGDRVATLEEDAVAQRHDLPLVLVGDGEHGIHEVVRRRRDGAGHIGGVRRGKHIRKHLTDF